MAEIKADISRIEVQEHMNKREEARRQGIARAGLPCSRLSE